VSVRPLRSRVCSGRTDSYGCAVRRVLQCQEYTLRPVASFSVCSIVDRTCCPVTLHNRLLLSLLHNASSPPSPHSHSPTTVRKRKRGGVDDLDFDADDTTIEPKARVQQWMMGISGRERARMRRAVIERATEEDANGEEEAEWGGAKDKWSSFTPSQSSCCCTSRIYRSCDQQ
jgi:hypothetical protein